MGDLPPVAAPSRCQSYWLIFLAALNASDLSASEVTTIWRYTNVYIIIIIIKRRSSDSHVFQWAQRPSKIAPSPGEYGPPSNSWFPGPTKVSPQMASWSV